MAAPLTFHYDRVGDILYIETTPPYAEQDSGEIGDEVVARFNPETGLIESLEVLFFSARLKANTFLDIPVTADLRLAKSTTRRKRASTTA